LLIAVRFEKVEEAEDKGTLVTAVLIGLTETGLFCCCVTDDVVVVNAGVVVVVVVAAVVDVDERTISLNDILNWPTGAGGGAMTLPVFAVVLFDAVAEVDDGADPAVAKLLMDEATFDVADNLELNNLFAAVGGAGGGGGPSLIGLVLFMIDAHDCGAVVVVDDKTVLLVD
jgi:hypothetical protein